MAKTLEPRLGFTVWIEPRTGMSPAAQAAFMRRMEDYLDARDLQCDGAPLRAVIWSPDHGLSATDQVELLDWLIADAAVCTASVSPLMRHSAEPASIADGYVLVRAADTAIAALSLLYRARRVSAELYLQILGGFIRPAAVRSPTR